MTQNLNNETAPARGSIYEPIGMWGYIGYAILFVIPVVGLVLAAVLSFSGGNVNRKNLARAFLLVKVLLLVFAVIIVAAAIIFGDAIQAAIGEYMKNAMGLSGIGDLTGMPGMNGTQGMPAFDAESMAQLEEFFKLFGQGGY